METKIRRDHPQDEFIKADIHGFRGFKLSFSWEEFKLTGLWFPETKNEQHNVRPAWTNSYPFLTASNQVWDRWGAPVAEQPADKQHWDPELLLVPWGAAGNWFQTQPGRDSSKAKHCQLLPGGKAANRRGKERKNQADPWVSHTERQRHKLRLLVNYLNAEPSDFCGTLNHGWLKLKKTTGKYMQKIEPTRCKEFILFVYSANGNWQLQAKDSEGSNTQTPASASRIFPSR